MGHERQSGVGSMNMCVCLSPSDSSVGSLHLALFCQKEEEHPPRCARRCFHVQRRREQLEMAGG